ncbi:Hybrid signal transduction histidine kinase A [Durusdinium trenchii]|uniref:histidine kinase n=1 Tax=Durusdinium trenchii TaxID=1381693 RepID=A0ABP0LAW8_9DINO
MEEMRKKMEQMQEMLHSKGLGKAVEAALAAAGLTSFCRGRDVFERLYRDALRRMRVYAENQLRLLKMSGSSFNQALHHLAAHPMAAVGAAMELHTSNFSSLQALQDCASGSAVSTSTEPRSVPLPSARRVSKVQKIRTTTSFDSRPSSSHSLSGQRVGLHRSATVGTPTHGAWTSPLRQTLFQGPDEAATGPPLRRPGTGGRRERRREEVPAEGTRPRSGRAKSSPALTVSRLWHALWTKAKQFQASLRGNWDGRVIGLIGVGVSKALPDFGVYDKTDHGVYEDGVPPGGLASQLIPPEDPIDKVVFLLGALGAAAVLQAAEFQNIIHSAGVPIIELDKHSCITQWNARIAELTGIPREQVLGKELLSVVLESCAAEVARVLKEAIEEGKSKADLEVMVESRYQDSVVLLLSCTPRMGRDDAIAGAICIGQDITRMKELDVKRSNIAATVTHELRSPLHGIIGLSEQLVSTGADARQKRQLKMISHCARRLLDLVMNIMDLSTLVQSKRLRLARDPVQMGKLIEEVQVLLSSAVDKAKRPIKKDTVRLIIDVPDQLPIIEADAHRCMQMLYNLVTNAFKYTKEGVVEVMARADDAKEILTVHVRDTGIGISPAACERVFLPFEQEDQDDNRQFEGMGLGLAISREVAVKHGGPWMGGGRVFFPARDHDMTTMTTGQR